MTPAQAMTRYCNAKTRHGAKCRLEAGWGTAHAGRGPCKLHGGRLPNVIKHHERLAAIDFAIGAIGAEVDIHPLDALLLAVRLAAGVVAYWRVKLLAIPPNQEPPDHYREGYRIALVDLSRFSKAALDAGVADRQVRIAERLAERIALAAEEALAKVQLPASAREEFVRTFADSLSRLESEPIDITVADVRYPTARSLPRSEAG